MTKPQRIAAVVAIAAVGWCVAVVGASVAAMADRESELRKAMIEDYGGLAIMNHRHDQYNKLDRLILYDILTELRKIEANTRARD